MSLYDDLVRENAALRKRVEEQQGRVEQLEFALRDEGVWKARATGAERENAALRKRVEELEAHEQQTHEQLGAILGTDDALHVLAARLKARAEKAEAGLAELSKLYREQSGRPSQELLDATIKELTERAEKAERERDEARALLIRQQDTTIDAFKRGDTLQADLDKMKRERDETMASLDAELEMRKYEPVCACMVDHHEDVCGVHSPAIAKLQADLDAARALGKPNPAPLKLGHEFVDRKQVGCDCYPSLDTCNSNGSLGCHYLPPGVRSSAYGPSRCGRLRDEH